MLIRCEHKRGRPGAYCKLGFAALYFKSTRLQEAGRKIVELMMVNKNCTDADDLYSKIIAERNNK